MLLPGSLDTDAVSIVPEVVLADELRLVEEVLRRAVASDVSVLSKASDYLIRSGGKRIRPKLVLLSYKAAGGEALGDVIPLAAAVELLHTASLVHDDINDRSPVRRGQSTVNARWGNDLALLVGDFVFVRFLGLLSAFDSGVIRVLADCCTAIVEGETLQMSNTWNVNLTEEEYLRIVALKTAKLFSACTELGAVLAGGTQQQVMALQTYGHDVGTAFQIRDDTLDLVGVEDELGKPVAVDLEQGKMSLATVYALKATGAREALLSGDGAKARALLWASGAIDDAMRAAKRYAEQARGALAILPESSAKRALFELADFAVARHE